MGRCAEVGEVDDDLDGEGAPHELLLVLVEEEERPRPHQGRRAAAGGRRRGGAEGWTRDRTGVWGKRPCLSGRDPGKVRRGWHGGGNGDLVGGE